MPFPSQAPLGSSVFVMTMLDRLYNMTNVARSCWGVSKAIVCCYSCCDVGSRTDCSSSPALGGTSASEASRALRDKHPPLQ